MLADDTLVVRVVDVVVLLEAGADMQVYLLVAELVGDDVVGGDGVDVLTAVATDLISVILGVHDLQNLAES